MTTPKAETSHALSNARAHLAGIVEGVEALEKIEGDDGPATYGNELFEDTIEGVDALRERLQESALSVEVRTDWRAVGAEDDKPTHYRILLTCGGPHLELRGELSEYGEPETAVLYHQDWGTPLEALETTSAEDDALLAFASLFYFGE